MWGGENRPSSSTWVDYGGGFRWKMSDMKKSEHPVLFFDGICNLCNVTVDFLISKDKKRVLRFSSLQGRTYKTLQFPDLEPFSFDYVVLWEGERIFRRSDAILRSLIKIGGLWKLSAVFLLVPRSVRDCVYSYIARHRYNWFGKAETCRLPSPEEKERFLD